MAVKNKDLKDSVTMVKRTTLSLSLTEEDKKFLKSYAAMKGKTVAGVVKDWIDAARMESK